MIWREETACGCKLNLRLKVTAVRPDGLHELSTLFWPLDFPGDLLEAEEAAGLTVTVPGSPQLETADNLVARAAGIFAEAAGIAPAWHFTLHKRTPVAAGLGGGSADAAAALMLLNRRYGRFSAAELAELALKLGADVPFFLSRRPAWGTGVGEKLAPLENAGRLPETLVVFPGFPVSAKWAYQHMSEELIEPDAPDIRERFAVALAAPEDAPWAELCRNDLAPALWRKFPLLNLLRDAMLDRGAAAVQVSGSGSSLFALFPRGGADAAADALKSRFGGMVGMRIFTGGKEW